MNPRIRLLSSILPLGFLTGCPPLPPEPVSYTHLTLPTSDLA